jgi:uncharacterized phage infection (PIP) family protein YhgE
MPVDSFKTKGPAKSQKPDSGGGGSKQYPILGIVKDNIDPTRSGRIRVTLQDGKGSTSPDKAGAWVTVQRLTTFFGSIGSSSGNDKENYGTYKNNPSSYGQWQAPPDIGTKVICIFVNGDTNAGYYIGAVPEPETLQMVPAIGASDKVTLNEGEANGFGGATRLPVTNLNTNNKDKANSNEFLDTPRPVHSYTASVMSQQGIIRDPVRGPISSSASREAASRVGWGVSTPGRPIYEGGYDDENLPDNLEQSKGEQLKVISRRGGHSFVMDDGDIIGRDQLIRIRTALGHQILMSDDGQTLMLLHSNGQSYIELGKEGTVDIFSTNSINLRTQGDFNVHADRDINLHAMEKLNIQAKNIHVNSEEETKFRAGKDYRIEALSNYTVKAASAFAVKSGGEASMVAGGQAFVNGSKVNLNSGSPGLSPATVPIITLVAQTDTLFEEEKGWAAAPGKLLSVASRTPAHFPWAGAGIGVDIKTSGNASDNLPKAPSAAVQAVNNNAATSGATPPNAATVASVPSTAQVSGALDKNTTGAVLGAVATTAATGPTAVAVAGGAAIIPTSAGGKVSGLIGEINKAAGQVTQIVSDVNNVANQASTAVTQAAVAVGSFAQTPQQLTQSGILKPGSATLIHGLASAGKSIVNAVPDTLFTGKAGAENITSLVKNVNAQAQSVVNVMQSAQKALGKAGILTGKESSTQTAGLVTAASTAGIEQTINVVKAAAGTATNLVNSASSITSSIANSTNRVASAITTATGAGGSIVGAATGAVSTASNLVGQLQNTANQVSGLADKAGSVLNAIGAGNQAANLANSLGGLGGIANALKGMGDPGSSLSLTGLLDSVKGIAGSAFDAIVKGFPKLEANIPQYLTDFAKKAATKAAVVSSTVPGGATDIAEDALADAASSATGELIAAGEGLTADINNTVAGITGSLQNPINVTTQGTTSATGTSSSTGTKSSTVSAASIINTVNQTSTLVNTVTSAAGSVTSTTTNLINSVTGTSSSTSKIVNNVNNVVNEINGLSGAAQSLKGGITSLANAAKSVQAGGGSAKASALSSGINNLPGGIKSISSVLDKATGAINSIPGTGELSGLLKNAQTDVQNGIASVNGVLNDISSITNKAGGIGAAIASKLPLGEASQLLSALSALGSGGSSPIKLPDLGFNTLNRSELTSQITKVIGDLGIPKPNFVGGVKDETVDKLLQKLIDAGEKRKLALEKYEKLNAEFTIIDNDFTNKYNTLPEGDPALEAAFVKLKDIAGKLSLAIDELEGADTEYNAAAADGLRDTPGGRLFGI